MLSQSVSWSPSIRAAYCTWTRGERFFCLLATPAYNMIHTTELNEDTKAHKFTSTETETKHKQWMREENVQREIGGERKGKEDKRNEGTVWCLMEELDYCKTEQNRHVTFRKSDLRLSRPIGCYIIVLSACICPQWVQNWRKLTASPSTFSLEPRWLPTTDSSTATQRCLSGKLGAMKYRDCPGQQEVWGCDSSFSTYGMSTYTNQFRWDYYSTSSIYATKIFCSMFWSVPDLAVLISSEAPTAPWTVTSPSGRHSSNSSSGFI